MPENVLTYSHSLISISMAGFGCDPALQFGFLDGRLGAKVALHFQPGSYRFVPRADIVDAKATGICYTQV
jgi:hypothetical protein